MTDLYTSNETNLNDDREDAPDISIDDRAKSSIVWMLDHMEVEEIIDDDTFQLRCYLRASPEAKLTCIDQVSELIRRNNEMIAHLTKINGVLGEPQHVQLPDVVI